MILTVTLNPLLERRLQYSAVKYGQSNRNPSESLNAGGKGINVSRQLNNLNVPNIAFTFAGGYSGKIYKKILNDEAIHCSYVQSINETRNGTVVIDNSQNIVSTFFGMNTSISDSEADEFLIKLEKMISNCEIVVLSGSSPGETTDKIFPEAIRISNRLDKISILDTYGKHLKECLDAVPTIIHNNHEEIDPLFHLSDEDSLFRMMDNLYSKGIKQVYITNGAKPLYASNFDFHFKVFIKEINLKDSTGSGDAFTAGVAYGWQNNLTFEETLIIASSLGALNASDYNICSSKISDVERFRNNINVVPVGKKMKTINVTPR